MTREDQLRSTAGISASLFSTVDQPPISLYKVGGSLLTLPDLGERLGNLLQRQSESCPLLIAGGGATADLVREWDHIHNLGNETAHWLALESVRLNEELLRTIVSRATIVDDEREAMAAWRVEQVPILSVVKFLRAREATNPHRLPHCWDVTSDSIAAWVTLELNAAELILLKSRDCPAKWDDHTDDELLVDGYFSNFVPMLNRLGWVNMRADHLQIEWLCH